MSADSAEATKPLPRLRTDLVTETRPGGTYYVKVSSRPQGFLLYDLELALAKLLDGRRSAAEVLEQAGRLGIPATPQSLHKFLRQLWQYGFLDVPDPEPVARTVSSPETFSGREIVVRLWSEGKQDEALSYLEMMLGRFPEDEGLMQLQTLLSERRRAELKEAPVVTALATQTHTSLAPPTQVLERAPSQPLEQLDADRNDSLLREAIEEAPEAVARRAWLRRRRRLIVAAVVGVLAIVVPLIPLPLTITEACQLLASQEAVLRAGSPSFLVSVEVKEGQMVKKGDLLVVVEASEALKEVQVLEAERSKAVAASELGKRGARPEELERARKMVATRRNEIASAARSYQRKRALFAQQMVSRDEVETAQAEMVSRQGGLVEAEGQLKMLLAGPSSQELVRLEADLKAIDARLAVARATYAAREVKSPIDGRIATARIELKKGTTIAAGAPMVEVLSVDRMRVELYVPQARIDDLKVGLPITVKVPNLPDERFEGVVEFVSLVAEARGEPPEQFVRVDTSIDNTAGLLRPQMTGYAEIRLGHTTVGARALERLRRWLKFRMVL